MHPIISPVFIWILHSNHFYLKTHFTQGVSVRRQTHKWLSLIRTGLHVFWKISQRSESFRWTELRSCSWSQRGTADFSTQVSTSCLHNKLHKLRAKTCPKPAFCAEPETGCRQLKESDEKWPGSSAEPRWRRPHSWGCSAGATPSF